MSGLNCLKIFLMPSANTYKNIHSQSLVQIFICQFLESHQTGILLQSAARKPYMNGKQSVIVGISFCYVKLTVMVHVIYSFSIYRLLKKNVQVQCYAWCKFNDIKTPTSIIIIIPVCRVTGVCILCVFFLSIFSL